MKLNIPKDSAMLLDIQYVPPKRGRDGEKIPDYLYIIWKDLNTGKKHTEMIPEPLMELWFEKEELRNHQYIKDYVKKEDANMVVCKYNDMTKVIANDLGDYGRDLLNRFYSTQNRAFLDQITMSPYAFGTDVDIRTYYRYHWNKKYANEKRPILNKAFMDIESDIMESNTRINDENYVAGVSPIDMVTIVDGATKNVYTFALMGVDAPYRSKKNPTEEEIKKLAMYDNRLNTQRYYYEHPEEIESAIHAMFDDEYPDMKYSVYLYTDEAKMLVHIFQLINKINPDFMGIWNIAYDIPEIIGRLKHFGLDPAEVICPPDFPNKSARFKHDKFHFDIKNKTHFFRCASSTIYIDQMVNYGAIRKGRAEIRSFKLNDVADSEIKKGKLDYEESGTIKTLSYNNWLKYLLYNIKDVLLLDDIETKTNDMETYYYDALLNFVPYEQAYKQTIMLTAVSYVSYYEQGKIQGCNRNKGNYAIEEPDENEDDDDSYEGALVGWPGLIENEGVPLFGKPVNNVFVAGVDFDMSAFYPNSTIAMNIHTTTLICKLICPASSFDVRGGKYIYNGITDKQIYDKNADSFSDDIAREIIDNYQTGNVLSTAKKWLNLPGIAELEAELMEEM